MSVDLQKGMRLGDWSFDLGEARLSGPGGVAHLTPVLCRLLLCLAEQPGQVVDRSTLRHKVWADAPRADDELRHSIHELRELLGDSLDNPRYILTVPRRGYALIAPVAAASSETHASDRLATGGAAQAARRGSLMSELRRRNVFRVAVGYLVAAWLAVQVAQATFAPLRFPEWAMTLVIVLAVLGLPIAAVLAWAYEITPEGVVADAADGSLRRRWIKTTATLVAVAAVSGTVGVAGLSWWRSIRSPAGFDPPQASIAVLPLLDFSTDHSGREVGDGMSEELSTQLAQIPGMRVAARTSAFALRGQELDVRRIGQQLGVRYVLEGSIRRQRDRVRVTAQLIDATTGFHRWTASYDRPWRDLLSIQEELAKAITNELRVVMSPEQARRLSASATKDPRAYEIYLQGLASLRQGGGLSRIAEAEQQFQAALAEDPGFARAYAGLCETAVLRYGRTSAPAAMAAAETACRKAIETGASLRETELALARLYLASGRFEEAEDVFRGLLARNPRDADVHIGLGEALQGRTLPTEAERSFRAAIEVEPTYWNTHQSLGNFLFGRGLGREAAQAYRKVTELAPANPSGFNNLGAALLWTGDLQSAAAAFRRSNQIEPSRSTYSNLGTVLYFQRDFPAAAEMYTKAIELAEEDHQPRGGRGDALWFVDGRRYDAIEDYRNAIELARRSLAVNPRDASVWAQLGYYYGRVGDAAQSSRYVEQALTMAPDAPYVSYYGAVAAADRGDIEAAAALVEQAVRLGYSKELVGADPALAGVVSRMATSG